MPVAVLSICRSGIGERLEVMRSLDRWHMQFPFAGSSCCEACWVRGGQERQPVT